MTPILPSELLAGSWELICCACMGFAALFSYLLAAR